ncbi:MAG: hydantoinase/oxoprolinase N-terminal domain-containing protein, partial [Salinivirgaceae bacterium]|nr:hydantoinase/oxoprolinase N-terminal domain-containing protein [Salinivirgaceae bacterium]
MRRDEEFSTASHSLLWLKYSARVDASSEGKRMIIGLDVGGTHTDAVLIGKDCILRQVKVPTDSSNLLESVWSALDKVTADVPAPDIQ